MGWGEIRDPSVEAPDQALTGAESVGAASATAQEPPRSSDQRRLSDLRAGNTTRERALAAQGVALNEQAMVALQTCALIRLFVGDDPARQLAYDIAYQEAVAEGLGEVEADLRRRKLTGGLVVPGANGKLRG